MNASKVDRKCEPLHVNKPKPPKTLIAPNFEDIIKHYIAPCEPSNRYELTHEVYFSVRGEQIELHKH
jgi:hypothetical protein